MTKFAPSKPFVSIGSVGESGHGKKTLTAAITFVLAKQGNARAVTYDELLLRTPKKGKVVILWSDPEYETATRHYRHLPLAENRDYVIRLLIGMVEVDGLILVASVFDGVSALNREHLRLAHRVGISSLVVFLNKADTVDDPERVRLVEHEVRSLLNECDFAGDEAPVIVGSALKALEGDQSEIGEPAILRLLDAMDSAIPTPERDIDKPFLLAFEDVLSIPDRGTMVTGRVERGSVGVGDVVEIVGMRDAITSAVVGSIDKRGKPLETAEAGDEIGVVLIGVDPKDLARGQVLAKPGSIKQRRTFDAISYFLSREEGGCLTDFRPSAPAPFYIRTTDVAGRLDLPQEVQSVKPGGMVPITCKLNLPIALETGLRFGIRDEGRTVGVGCITRLLEEV